MEVLLYLATNIMRIFTICIFNNTILEKPNIKKPLLVAAYGTFFIINSTLHLLFGNPILNLSTNIIPMLLITLLYKNSNYKMKFFAAFSFCAVAMFVDWLIVSLMPTSILVKNNVIQNIILLTFVFILRIIYNRKLEKTVNSTLIWFLVLISIGTIIIGQLTISEFNIKSFIIAIILLAINFLSFYMYDKLIDNMKIEQTLKLIEASNIAYQNQLNLMNESQKRVRLIKHDIINHVFNIKNSILNKEYKNALSYIDAITEYVAVEKEYVNTGNAEINCLLNYKLSLADELGVDFSCDISLPEQLNVSNFDMTVILGNLLDNSLDALKQVDNKILLINIFYSKGIVRINTENTFLPNQKDERKGEHGLGLTSVQKSLDKYNGILKTSYSGERFYVAVALYNS